MALIRLQEQLRLERCPHCGIDRPNLPKIWEGHTTNSEKTNKRLWRVYSCARCGGVTTAYAKEPDNYTDGIFPYDKGKESKDVPQKPRAFLEL